MKPATSQAATPNVGLVACEVCGEPIKNRRKGARTCLTHAGVRLRPQSKRTPEQRKKYRKETVLPRRFITLDGEATDKEGHYGLLAASTGRYIQNRKGLSTEECLDFLLSLAKHHAPGGGKPIYVWFAMDYDVNMILCDLPLKGDSASIEELRATGETRWRGYTIKYWPRKILQISRGKKVHTSYDTWGFFQSSFEGALKAWKIELPEIITEGKAARGTFEKWSMEKIRSYNAAELQGLRKLANELRASIAPLDLTMYGWHGPAAMAGSWLNANGVKRFLAELPPNVHEAATRAYFGGRIDVKGYGFVDPVYHYDIVSAYPSATRNLPDLSKVSWERVTKEPDKGIYMCRIRWKVDPSHYWTPFPWRKSDGAIRYPHSGEGWYWHPELKAAKEKYGECYEVLDCYRIVGRVTYPLRNLIQETFEYRNELKKAGNPSNIPVKLILNSIYGKFAQTVGKATFYNPVWAGLITSETRALLMQAITDDTVCVMTDSVWSRAPLTVKQGDGLGEWMQEEETAMVVAEAGLYQAWKPDGESMIWQRGFDKRAPVDVEGLVRTWLDDDPTYAPVYSVHRFIGMGLASVSSYPWRKWVDIDRTIHPVPLVGTTKRRPHLPEVAGIREGNFMALPLRPADNDDLSSPYRPITIDPDLTEFRLQDECYEGE